MTMEIDQNWPGLILLGENGQDLNLPASDSEIYALEKAINHGPGTYIVRRPDATITVLGSEAKPEPEPTPDPTPEPDPEPDHIPVYPDSEPDPAPEPDPGPTPPPPPASGPMDERFARLLTNPGLHDYLAMNKAQEVWDHTRPSVNKGETNPHFTYDAEQNAFKCDTRGASDISSKWQIRRYFPQLNPADTDTRKIAFQWEFKYNEAYLRTGGLRNYKAFQLSNTSEGLMFEYQHRFGETDNSAVALPTNRIYRSIAYSESSRQDPLNGNGPAISRINGAPMDNWQPGGDTAADRREAPFGLHQHLLDNTYPFLIRANCWVRQTTEFECDGKELRARIWMSDEETPPTLVLASVRDPGRGYLISSDMSKASLQFQNWWLELNSSQDVPVAGLVSWHKNFIVYKNASIPLE